MIGGWVKKPPFVPPPRRVVDGLLDRFLFDIRDQRAESRIPWIKGYQITRIAECPGKVTLILPDRDQGYEHVSVCWVLLMRSLQECEGVSRCAGRIQRDGVDISVARVIRGQFLGLRNRSNAPA
jgi:hypothetical protein